MQISIFELLMTQISLKFAMHKFCENLKFVCYWLARYFESTKSHDLKRPIYVIGSSWNYTKKDTRKTKSPIHKFYVCYERILKNVEHVMIIKGFYFTFHCLLDGKLVTLHDLRFTFLSRYRLWPDKKSSQNHFFCQLEAQIFDFW